MFVKYYYLVRHGETIMNKEHRRQGEEGLLSPLGVTEVREVAKRLLNIKIDKMFVSPFERTRETGGIINSYLKLKDEQIIIAPLIAERRNPSNIVGKSYDDPVAKAFIDTMDESLHDPDLRISDEENFQDLKNRALLAQEYLIKNGEKYNLCITHGIFLKMFLGTLVYGEDLTVKQYAEITFYNAAHNAAITLIKYDYMKKYFGGIQRWWDNFLNDKDGSEEYSTNKSKIDKYSPWEILAYNDYTRDGVKRMKI